MKIGIDLDEVLVEYLAVLIDHHNATYNTSLTKEQFKSYKFWEIWGGTREEAIQKVYTFYQTADFKNLKPLPHSQKTIDILKQNHELFVITSRPHDIREITKELIDEHFPNTFSNIIFANHYSQNGEEITKKQICDSVGIEILIEDSLDYALECLNEKRKIFLFDYPWNQSEKLPAGIHRIKSWKEILRHI